MIKFTLRLMLLTILISSSSTLKSFCQSTGSYSTLDLKKVNIAIAEGNAEKELSVIKDKTISTLQKALINKDSIYLQTQRLQSSQETELFLTKVNLTQAEDQVSTANLANQTLNIKIASEKGKKKVWRTVAGISVVVNVALLYLLIK